MKFSNTKQLSSNLICTVNWINSYFDIHWRSFTGSILFDSFLSFSIHWRPLTCNILFNSFFSWYWWHIHRLVYRPMCFIPVFYTLIRESSLWVTSRCSKKKYNIVGSQCRNLWDVFINTHIATDRRLQKLKITFWNTFSCYILNTWFVSLWWSHQNVQGHVLKGGHMRRNKGVYY